MILSMMIQCQIEATIKEQRHRLSQVCLICKITSTGSFTNEQEVTVILFNIEAHRHYSQVYSLNFFTEYFRAKN